ncbi:MAG: LysM domain-containing protein [Thiohalomonadales bacterium]|nr:LysM domain-containing protein [Thiohalomonadales bacterium]
MLNNKPTGKTLIRLLSLFVLGGSLLACASAPEEPAPAPEPVITTAPEPEPAPPPPPPTFKPDYPDRYVVVKGDTLWDIASRFLHDPWLWPQVWQINPKIRNPHLIYPGDVIVLYYVDGKPYLTLEGAAGVVPPKEIETVKLSPKVRYESLDKAIDTIPRSVIGPFLYRPRVVTQEEIDDAPYIVSSFEEHLISGTGNRVYAKKITDNTIAQYGVIRPGQVYRDPETNEILGYEVIRVAAARVVRGGDPTTLTLVDAKREVLNGDLLLPSEKSELDFNFFPQPPRDQITGQIISVFDGVSQIGQYNVVVLNRGKRDGLIPGHVLAIYQSGKEVQDPQSTSWVTLPDERAGVLMIFKTYDKVSYALVMRATRAIHVYDRVTNP